MATGLVDTSIVVDVLRAYLPALAWLQTQTGLAVSGAVWIEVLEGVINKQELVSATKILRGFELVELTDADFIMGRDLLIRYKLSHGADGGDCLIAATSQRLSLPLYTHNLKHFTPMIGALAIKPY